MTPRPTAPDAGAKKAVAEALPPRTAVKAPSQHPGLRKHILIEHVTPSVDGGRYPVKRVVGDTLTVEADAFRDGHDLIRVSLAWRRKDADKWQAVPMHDAGNDRWRGEVVLTENTRYVYRVEAWTDHFATWKDWTARKIEAGQDISTELAEGRQFIERVLPKANKADAQTLKEVLELLDAAKKHPHVAEAVVADEAWAAIMARLDPRTDLVTSPDFELIVDRPLARFGSWYEFFPRSSSTEPGEHGTFRQAERRLHEIKAMGFDVVYLPPIHPIGLTARKGKNNALVAGPDDPGSPWAIGNAAGGHKAVEPKLGTLEDFDHFVATAKKLGLEIALDFAIQCSPDHPWVKEHPEYFSHRPDGTIKYAENPPKKYQDIYPINFDSEKADQLWLDLLDIVLFWVQRGITVFRVDNPHTKPVYFWEWLIATVQVEHPEVIFLSEAFTRPKMMQALAKAGFTQSYSYFTWRHGKAEFEQYLYELTRTEQAEFMRANFWPNTPDILPPILQHGGRPAFKQRLVLAATMMPSYGIYSGYELVENAALPGGKEEYLDSEKYEIKVRDWHKLGNLTDFVTRINAIRRENPALQLYTNIEFLPTTNDQLLAYAKSTPDGSNVLLIVVNLDPWHPQEGMVHVPAGVARHHGHFDVLDLTTGAQYLWHAGDNYVRLDPQVEPAHILRIERRH